MRFFHREEELAALERLWRSQRGEFVVVYGRRRVGKSALLAHFASTKQRVVFFEALAAESRDNLTAFEAQIAALDPSPMRASLHDWQGAFAAIHALAETEPLLVILDEFQFVARKEPAIGSHINRLMEANTGNPNLMLVVSGSDVSFFTQEVMGYSAVTYGRRTASFRLRPFDFADARAFMPGWQIEDQIRAYAVFGGMPYYLLNLEKAADLKEAILEEVFLPAARLQEEPRFLFAQEGKIREPSGYLSVLTAIAAGLTQSNQIAQRAGIDSRVAKHHLDTLTELELISNRFPVTRERPGRLTHWHIEDAFLRFWFRFVAPNISALVTERGARAHADRVMASLDEFVSLPFEDVCRQWVRKSFPGLSRVGGWWGTIRQMEAGRQESRRYEADVAATDADGRIRLLGSCKWTDAEHNAGELAKLKRIRAHLDAPDAELFFFSRSGFSPALQDAAGTEPGIRLCDLSCFGQEEAG